MALEAAQFIKIAQEIHALESEQPWECMDGFSEEPPPTTIAEGGFELNPPYSRAYDDSLQEPDGLCSREAG
jgi:spermine oxidase